MSFSLFFANIKSFWVLTLIIILVLFLYAAISVAMFDPDNANNIQQLLDSMPSAMISAFGFDDVGTTLTGFVATFYYGFVIVMFSMIYSILVSHGLVCKLTDNGSMAYLLSTPITRKKIVNTQVIFLLGAFTILVWLPFVLIIIMSASIFPGMLNVFDIVKLSLIAYFVIVACGGISFLCSCIFNDAKFSRAFCGGIPIFFLIMNLLQGVGKQVEWVKYLSIYSFLDINRVLADSGYVWMTSIILLILSVILYGASIVVFDKKSFIV